MPPSRATLDTPQKSTAVDLVSAVRSKSEAQVCRRVKSLSNIFNKEKTHQKLLVQPKGFIVCIELCYSIV